MDLGQLVSLSLILPVY